MNLRIKGVTLIKFLIIFLLGIAFCQWVFPLFDSLLSLLCQYIETVKIKLVEKTTESTVHIAQLKDELEEKPSSARAIGFMVQEQEDGEDYYEDD